MKNTILAILFAFLFLPVRSMPAISEEKTIAAGDQPQIGIDNKGMIRVVFGREDKIFCVESSDKGLTFSNPVLVAEIPGMHLGNVTRASVGLFSPLLNYYSHRQSRKYPLVQVK